MMVLFIFFFNDTATTEIYTLSLHDALPIWIARAIRRAHAPVAERPRGGERAEAPDRVRRPARMRTEAPVHRHAHVAVHAVTGEVARHVGDHAWREEAHAAERAALDQHLVER